MLHMDAAANGKEIEIAIGHSFELCLPENPTTGFRWVMGSDGKPVCTLLGDQFHSDGLRPGQGGSHCWRFQVAQVGEGTLTLTYQRPWEQVSAATQTFTLQVRARS
jgi:inhibitor of cysteine peptidase